LGKEEQKLEDIFKELTAQGNTKVKYETVQYFLPHPRPFSKGEGGVGLFYISVRGKKQSHRFIIG